jgi:ribosomal protein S18 acetylase RimI-like enzyme
MTGEIEYTETGKGGLDLITPLWYRLNGHHGNLSQHFSDQYPRNTFARRKQELLEKSGGGDMHVGLARDTAAGELVGYCVSTVSATGDGEIDSIYIEEEYRRCGIGHSLMRMALDWMGKHAVKKLVVQVIVGNEEAQAFYQRYGFYPRYTVFQQVGDSPEEIHD